MNSKQKGARGERELAKVLREHGYETRRTQQYCGGTDESADIVGLPYIHVECKRVEKLNIWEAYQQAWEDAKNNNTPAVFHRKNGQEWLVTMRLDQWMELYKEYEAGRSIQERSV
jgi:Holliday junction resolvase